MTKKILFMRPLFFLVLLCLPGFVFAQRADVHVHNDYAQKIPFWGALAAGASSLEADVFLKNGKLYVTHSEAEIVEDRFLDNLYLNPLKKALHLKLLPKDKPFQLLIDVKSAAYPTLEEIQKELEKYPEITKNAQIKIVISGSRPQEKDYKKYKDFISFDYQNTKIPKEKSILKKIALFSYDFKDFSVWNGKGKIVAAEQEQLTNIIAKVHEQKKPIRFWGTPDSKSAWKAFQDLGIDFINTDEPFRCADYLRTLPRRWYKNTVFSPVYEPTFASDKGTDLAQNIILMIGDGNGLSQISAAVLANGGALTMTKLRSSGFIKTQSADDFTTDSAAAGTALATGKKAKNRAIGVDAHGKPAENLVEFLSKHNYNAGCITTDEIFGATPSVFYAHQKDRGMEKEIAEALPGSKLALFIGGGAKKYKNTDWAKHKVEILENLPRLAETTAERAGFFFSEGGVPSVLKGRGNALAEATKQGLAFLTQKKKPFFLMVEGSLIDTYGHHNNVAGVVTEAIDFDRAVSEAVKFADKDKNTLVVVLADHETSGFSVPQGNTKTHHIEGGFFSDDHTGMLVPVFAYGPQSQQFEGCYENTEIFHKIIRALGLKK